MSLNFIRILHRKRLQILLNLQMENCYDGLCVSTELLKDFMIQGGGYDTDMTQHETDTITGEFIQNGYLI